MSNKRHIWIGPLLGLLILAGCSPADGPQIPAAGAYATNTRTEDEAGSVTLLNVPVEQAGDPIGVDFRGILISGSASVQLADAEGQIVWQELVTTPGLFAVNTTVEAPEAGEYCLELTWPRPMQIQYSLQWKPGQIKVPIVSPLALLGGAGMIVVALGFVIHAAVDRLGWGYLGLGALAWVVTVALKFAWAIPVNTPVYNGLIEMLPETVSKLIFDLYVGVLTGVFEVALVWLVMRYTRLGRRVPWSRALAFGIGFGAVEALLVGLSNLTNVITAISTPSLFSLALLEQIAKLSSPLYSLAPIVERFSTVLIHIFANTLIFYAIARRQPRWFWLAFGYKTLIDAVAAHGQVTGIETLAKLWAIESVVVVWGAIGWLGSRQVQRNYPAEITHDSDTSRE